MLKANWRYGKSNAPGILRRYDQLIRRANGKRDWFLIFTGTVFLLFTFLSQNWGLGLLLAFCFSWLALWPIRIRQFGFKRGTRYYWEEAKKFDTIKWATPKVVIKKKQILAFIRNSLIGRWFHSWPKFFQELFWSTTLILVGICLFFIYKDYPMNDEKVIALIRVTQKYISIPDSLGNAVFMGGTFIVLGVLRIGWFIANWLLNKLSFQVKILVNFS